MALKGALLVAATTVAAFTVGGVVIIGSAATGEPSLPSVARSAAPPAASEAPLTQAAPKTTLHLPTTLHLVNTTSGAVSLDATHLLFSGGITHRHSKKVIGTSSYTCVAHTGGVLRQACRGAIALRGGVLLVTEAIDIGTGRVTGQVVGGSGAYQGARGDISGQSVRQGQERITLSYSLG